MDQRPEADFDSELYYPKANLLAHLDYNHLLEWRQILGGLMAGH